MENRILQSNHSTCFFDKFIPTALQSQPCLIKTIYFIGLLVVLRLTFRIIYSLWDLWIAPRNLSKLATRFGAGSYVVITGTTAGIGKSLARHFVQLGFNIV
jgi:17beta-estradiol 17-dehydrogenase / very-long-chain 3-oxoacyl-CoA reductase